MRFHSSSAVSPILALLLSSGCGPDAPGGVDPFLDPAPEVYESIEDAVPRFDPDATERPPPQLRLLSRDEYGNTVRDLFQLEVGEPTSKDELTNEEYDLLEWWEEVLPVEARPSEFAFDNSATAGLVSSRHTHLYALAALEVAPAVVELQERWLDCESMDDSIDSRKARRCVDRFLSEVAPRIFRRPLTDSEEFRYREAMLSQRTAGDALELGVAAMLTSPHFLYRSEVGLARRDGISVLDPWERASALSYTLWRTMPDDGLFEAAEAGELDTPEGLSATAETMLNDPRADAAFATFVSQWLAVEAVRSIEKAGDYSAPFPGSIREKLYDEPADFAVFVATRGAGTFEELLVADYTMYHPELAAHYEVDERVTTDLRLDLSSTPRLGLLGQASMHAVTAHPINTSPTFRGLWVRERILCQVLPDPPPDVQDFVPLDDTLSTRERYAQHMTDEACLSCHQYMDAIGFGFEHFDPIGQWRDDDGGHEIDPSGYLTGVEALGDGVHNEFADFNEMVWLLAGSDRAPTCFTMQLRRWTTGTQLDDEDGLGPLVAESRADGWNIQNLRRRMVASPAFWSRE